MSIFPQKEHYSFNSKTSNSEPLLAIKIFDMTRLAGFAKTILKRSCKSILVVSCRNGSKQSYTIFDFSDCLQKHVMFFPGGREKLLIGGNSILKCLVILF